VRSPTRPAGLLVQQSPQTIFHPLTRGCFKLQRSAPLPVSPGPLRSFLGLLPLASSDPCLCLGSSLLISVYFSSLPMDLSPSHHPPWFVPCARQAPNSHQVFFFPAPHLGPSSPPLPPDPHSSHGALPAAPFHATNLADAFISTQILAFLRFTPAGPFPASVDDTRLAGQCFGSVWLVYLPLPS